MKKDFNFMVFTGGKKGNIFIDKLLGAKLRPKLICTPDPFFIDEKNLFTRLLKRVKKRIFAKLKRGADKNNFGVYFKARKLLIPVWPAQNVNSKDFAKVIKDMKTDYIFVFGFPILKEFIFKAPKQATINFHSSLLPKHRGANPEFWTIREKNKVTGISFNYIDNGIDTGKVIKQYKMPQVRIENSQELSQRLTELGARYFIRLIWRLRLGELINGNVKRIIKASYEKPVTEEDRTINIEMDANTIQRIILASAAYSRAILNFRGKKYEIFDVVELKKRGKGKTMVKKDEFGNFLIEIKNRKLLYLITTPDG